MTAPLIYSMAPVKLNSTVLAAAEVRFTAGIISQTFQHSGNLFASINAVAGAVPKVTFKTPLKDALTTIGTSVLALTTFEVHITKFSASTYARTGAGANTKWAATSGCAYITGFSCSQGGVAMADVEVIPFSTDGTTAPLTRTDNNNTPTLSGEPLLHTIGPISIEGGVITGLNQLSVSMGHAFDTRISDGDKYARVGALLAGSPSISFEHLDPATLETTLSQIGVNIGTSTVAYFKSFDATTQLVSTSNAVSVTIASGRVQPDNRSFDQNRAVRGNYTVVPLSATTTHPLVISTSATAPST